jgi:hypothetical protein
VADATLDRWRSTYSFSATPVVEFAPSQDPSTHVHMGVDLDAAFELVSVFHDRHSLVLRAGPAVRTGTQETRLRAPNGVMVEKRRDRRSTAFLGKMRLEFRTSKAGRVRLGLGAGLRAGGVTTENLEDEQRFEFAFGPEVAAGIDVAFTKSSLWGFGIRASGAYEYGPTSTYRYSTVPATPADYDGKSWRGLVGLGLSLNHVH